MESNKEEALKCIEIARKALSANDFGKASKFLKKSIRLYPSDAASELLKKCESMPKTESTNDNTKSNCSSVPDFSELHGSAKPDKPTYTSAQRELAQKINRCKNNYYEVLSVSKSASDSEIKKGYRKMALQLHPDKNLAPGSTEAFKAVGKAFSVLSDPEKRRQYDLYGAEGVSTTTRRHYSNNSDDETDGFDPQEIFNMFFGGGFPSENVRVFRRGNTYYYDRSSQRRQQEVLLVIDRLDLAYWWALKKFSVSHKDVLNRHWKHENGFHSVYVNQNDLAAWLRFLPILVFILLTFGGNLFVSDPVYSLARKSDYIYRKATTNLDVEYYVKAGFDKSYPKNSNDRLQIENEIENSYVNYLRNACYQERINKDNLRRKGIYFGSADMVKQSEKMKTPSCDQLEAIFSRT